MGLFGSKEAKAKRLEREAADMLARADYKAARGKRGGLHGSTASRIRAEQAQDKADKLRGKK